jgi:two-component system, chemotaxis family, chemotaxis protein CheY
MMVRMSASASPSTAPHVLIAEDDQTAAAICARALANAGYVTSVACDGQAALQMLREGTFDLVVTDMAMPTMDGLALVRAMRADSRLTRLPVLFLTSFSEEEMRTRGFRAGCDGYLVKPVRPLELVQCVSELLSGALGTGARLGTVYLSGRLDGTSVGSLLAFLHGQGRSGLLRLFRFGAYGEVAVREGHPLTAKLGGSLRGEEALSALLGWNAGAFRFERFDVSEIDPELAGSFEELLARAEQRRLAG